MSFWWVTFRVALRSGDTLPSFIVETRTPGEALDRAIDELRLAEQEALVSWSCTGVNEVRTPIIRDSGLAT